MDPKELGEQIVEGYTLRNRIAYKWHEFRMLTSRKYRNDWNSFCNELTSYIKTIEKG